MQDNNNLKLYQKGRAGDGRQFELKAGRELHVVYYKNNNKKIFALNILALQEKGKPTKQYNKCWMVLSLAALVLLLVFSTLGKYLLAGLAAYQLYILMGLFFTTILFFMLLIRSFNRSYVFSSVHTDLPLLEFWINNPAHDEYQYFISTLETAIQQYKADRKPSYAKQLSGELRTLRRVMEAGILAEPAYLAAREKLLRLSDLA